MSKAISKLSREDYVRVFDALLVLCATGTGDIKSLKGFDKGTLRLRVGQMRIYLSVTGFLIEVIGVEQRGEVHSRKAEKAFKSAYKPTATSPYLLEPYVIALM